jgi:hypothetical protein
MSKVPRVPKDKFQLIGTASLLLASKMEVGYTVELLLISLGATAFASF